MTSDVEVTVTGLPFDEKAVTGIRISYGINTIPFALITLDSTAVNVLCNPEQYKNRDNEVRIAIKSKTGCIYFDGFLDGVSVNQTVGGMSYSVVIKNKFQRLFEIYPKCVGVMPASFAIFTAPNNLKIEQDSRTLFREMTVARTKLNLNLPIGELLLEYIKLTIKSQVQWELNTNKLAIKYNQIVKQFSDAAYINNAQFGLDLLSEENTDISLLRKCKILGYQCAEDVLNLTLGDHTDLWDMMLRTYSYLGCCLIIANNKMFIVPEASFLRGNLSKTGDRPNLALPNQYSGFSVNDIGYTNLAACHVMIDSAALPAGTTADLPQLITQYMGMYPAEGASVENSEGGTGILIVKASPFLMNGLTRGYCRNKNIQEKISNQDSHFSAVVTDSGNVKAAREASNEKYRSDLEDQKKILNGYAKTKYLQAKYGDRTGSLNTYFNPKWVPGTTGTLYTKQPGLFYQFYVNSVTHDITLSAPNSGNALTSVNFSATRAGSSELPGLREDGLYGYDTSAMEALQTKWINDISK